jgi:hypothetical protein
MSHSVTHTLRRLEGELTVFTAQLAQETAELRRNVDNQPTTGATFYARILEELTDRLEGLGQELHTLEGVSLDAISIEVRACGFAATCSHLPPAAACCDLQLLVTSGQHRVARAFAGAGRP